MSAECNIDNQDSGATISCNFNVYDLEYYNGCTSDCLGATFNGQYNGTCSAGLIKWENSGNFADLTI